MLNDKNYQSIKDNRTIYGGTKHNKMAPQILI